MKKAPVDRQTIKLEPLSLRLTGLLIWRSQDPIGSADHSSLIVPSSEQRSTTSAGGNECLKGTHATIASQRSFTHHSEVSPARMDISLEHAYKRRGIVPLLGHHPVKTVTAETGRDRSLIADRQNA